MMVYYYETYRKVKYWYVFNNVQEINSDTLSWDIYSVESIIVAQTNWFHIKLIHYNASLN